MEITKKLNIPAEFFYRKVVDSVIYDVQDSTGKTLKEGQLKNFEYIKKYQNGDSARITITEVKPNEAYAFETSTQRNEFIAAYTIRAIDEKQCEVKYHETMSSKGTVQMINDIIVRVLLGFMKKRQFKKMLEMIEQSY